LPADGRVIVRFFCVFVSFGGCSAGMPIATASSPLREVYCGRMKDVAPITRYVFASSPDHSCR
jgi:hypothetical protein